MQDDRRIRFETTVRMFNGTSSLNSHGSWDMRRPRTSLLHRAPGPWLREFSVASRSQAFCQQEGCRSFVLIAMALELEYRNTFIDVKEDFEEMGSSRARAQSSPPGRVRRISFSLEAASEEDAMRSYVGTLSQKTADLMKLQDETPTTACSSSPKSPMSPEVLEVEPEHPPILAEFFPLLPSQGSLGHPEVCRRPCIYFIAGHCENGNACAYCHMEHTEKTPKLDKRQRTIIQALSRPQLLGLVLHFCRSKAEQAGFLEEAAEILGMLAQESAGARPLSQMVSDRDLRNLHKTLGRMNFSNLIGLVTHQSSNRTGNATPSADFLAASLERLRMHFLSAGQL